MDRRDFLKWTLGGVVAGGILTFLNGCVARISETVYDKDQGTPWRCSNCGYLTRSTKDLSDTRCPRCMEKDLKRITEEELQKYIAEEKK